MLVLLLGAGVRRVNESRSKQVKKTAFAASAAPLLPQHLQQCCCQQETQLPRLPFCWRGWLCTYGVGSLFPEKDVSPFPWVRSIFSTGAEKDDEGVQEYQTCCWFIAQLRAAACSLTFKTYTCNWK